MPDALMLYTLNYYTVRKNRKVWGQKTAEEQIVALSSTIEELKDANLQLAKSIKGSSKPKASKPPARGKSNQSAKASPEKYPRLAEIEPSDPNFGWMVKPPKDGESLTKVVSGKTYHWCPKHKAWVKHSPEQCQMKATAGKQKQTKQTTNKETKSKDKGAG
eukprot:1787040-Ditylum_brightwellii.AAC.1